MSLLYPYLVERPSSPPSPSASSGGISFAGAPDGIDVAVGKLERRSRFTSGPRSRDSVGKSTDVARAPKSSASLLTCIDDALRSLDEAIVAEERAEAQQLQALAVVDSVDEMPSSQSRLRSSRAQSHEAGAQWICSSITAFAQERKRATLRQWRVAAASSVREPMSTDDYMVRWSATRTRSSSSRDAVPREDGDAEMVANVQGFRSPHRPFRWGAQDEVEEQPTRGTGARVGAELSKGSPPSSNSRVELGCESSPLQDRLSAVETENDFLRRALCKERLLYQALTRFAVRAHQVKAFAWRRLRLQAAACRALVAPTGGASDRLIEGVPQIYRQSARRLACVLQRRVLGHLSWSWRRLVEFDAFTAARAVVVRSLSSDLARQSLQAAFKEVFGEPGPSELVECRGLSAARRGSEFVVERVRADSPFRRISPMDVFAPR